ncbi:AEC family transporter [Haloplasma contractile]|uniref:Transporter protein n=1 Tax=Haloplasma contractile SSD-17B TaxID=1033810 RepID=F7PUC4_9MOLU|nr:AEC family transporter [Haloplasma contractile]ERJ11688.1 Transporter protein [Haloplasma contractile SSD-17B]
MEYFLFIFSSVILPIFIQVLAGYIVQKKFRLDTGTMAKIQFYVFIPALLFTKMYSNQVDPAIFLKIISVVLMVFLSLYIILIILIKVYKIPKKTGTTLANSVCLFNSGNFCIPLIELLYVGNVIATSVQIIILLTQSMLTNTFGIFNASFGKKDAKKAMLDIFKIPMIYAVLLGLIFRMISIPDRALPLWNPIWDALTILSSGLIPLALFTLGAQLANTKLSIRIPKVYLSIFLRLLIAPILAYGFVHLVGLANSANEMNRIAAQVIVICSAAPSAVNSVLLAIEYDNEPELASQIVFMSTLLSAVTVTGVIIFAMATL